ncbi:hypothetical protein GCM10012275_15130 [Longimycelium tulufanense]|uniref:Immunity protein Imm1 n=1 Tax=Longimycelium tulufanense TaxID=907463 RepID=A0A8J3FVJ5_9PSEU|nr:Imm1 family immunity protein [Longimycelium tulufanense]GGM45056.1 hypothetical protein GCM10012275_15130 [Longimycelium tulufanense]
MTLEAFDQQGTIPVTTQAELTEVIDRLIARTADVEIGLSLGFAPSTENDGRHQVVIGVGKNGHGFLQYVDDAGIFWTRAEQPRHGTTAYYFPGHPFSAPSEVEVPLETVRAGVQEYLDTGQRPSCAAWCPDPGVEWNMVLLP